MPFHFQPLDIPDIILVEPKVFHDPRGHFLESFKQSEFIQNGIAGPFVQDNISKSSKNILRGLHYQIPPYDQGKLVMALEGEIFDVAVDIRQNSVTYGKWISRILSETNHAMLYIPSGFAHGFCVMSDNARVMYKCTGEFAQQADRGIIWNDPDIGIEWPVTEPVLSEKDMNLPVLAEVENPF